MSEQTPPGLRVTLRRGSSRDFDAVGTSQRRAAWCGVADDEDRGAWFLAEDEAAQLFGYLSVSRSGGGHADFAMGTPTC